VIPSGAKEMHGVTRFGEEWNEVSNEFGMSYNNYHNEYIVGVQSVPSLVAVGTGLAVALVSIWFFFSLSFEAFGWSTFYFTPSAYKRAAPRSSYGNQEEGIKGNRRSMTWYCKDGFAAAIHSHRNIAELVIAILGTLVFVVLNSTLIGNVSITQGVEMSLSEADAIDGIFYGLEDTSKRVHDLTESILNEMNTAISSSSCRQVQSMREMVDELVASSDTLVSYISTIPEATEEFSNVITYYGIDVKDSVTILLYVMVVVALVGLYVSFYKLKHRRALTLTTVVTLITCVAFTVTTCLIMMGAMIGADFCMAPTSNALKMTPSGAARDIMTYYSSCIGSNPISHYQYGTYNLSSSVNLTVSAYLNTVCPQDKHLTSIRAAAQDACEGLLNMNPSLSCPPLREHILKTSETGLCSEFFTGTYNLFVTHSLTLCLLLILAWIMGIAVHSLLSPIQQKDVPDEEPLVLITDSYNGRDYDGLGNLLDEANMVDPFSYNDSVKMTGIEMEGFDSVFDDSAGDLDSQVRSLLE